MGKQIFVYLSTDFTAAVYLETEVEFCQLFVFDRS